MVIRILWVGLLLMQMAQAAGSGSLAWRASNQFSQGRYAESYMLFKRALHASRKEADLINERRVRLNIALILTHAREWKSADSALQILSTMPWDESDRIRYVQTHILAHNLRGEYDKALKIWKALPLPATDNSQKYVRASLEAAVSYAGAGYSKEALDLLENAQKTLPRSASGLIMVSRGLVENRLGELEQAGQSLEQAIEQARRAKRSWEMGRLLAELAVLKEKQKNQLAALDYHRRAYLLYEQLGLPHPFVFHLETYLNAGAEPENEELFVRLANARLLLEAPVSGPAILNSPMHSLRPLDRE